MRRLHWFLWGVIVAGSVSAAVAARAPSAVVENSGACDASAAVAIDASLFVVGCDEDNVLRVYRRGQAGEPVVSFDLTHFLQLAPKHQEVDIEGGAGLGGVDYWIGSHGRSRDGQDRPNRCRLFATQFGVVDGRVTMTYVGKPYRALIEDLTRDGQYKKYQLDRAATRAPKQIDALNIEGLAATPNGALWIGLRSPIVERKALLIPLLNPRQVIAGGHAQFGGPIELNLGGLGIRSIDYWPARHTYIIIAGPFAAGACRLYEWSGKTTDEPRAIEGVDLRGWNAEACVVYPDSQLHGVQIVCDDGNRPGARSPKRSPLRSFRSGWVRF